MRRLGLLLVALLLLAAAPAYSQGCSGLPNANQICAGPASGPAGFPGFRPLGSSDFGSGVIQGSNIAAGAIANSNLANMGANTVKGNFTGSTGSPADNTMVSCSGAGTSGTSGLQYTSGGGTGAIGCNATLANLAIADQQVTGGALVTPNNLAAGTNFTLDCGVRPLQWILNNAAFTITAPSMTTTNDQNCAVRVVNGSTASNAGAVTLTNFSGKSPGGAAFSTTPTVSAASVSYTNGSANITWTANGLNLGAIVFLANSGGALPTNFSTATLYYVVTTGTNTIQVATTPGGAAVVAGSAGTGTQTAYVPSVFDLVVLAINGPVYSQWVQVQ